jgi:polysaccharide export outer membrane protein
MKKNLTSRDVSGLRKIAKAVLLGITLIQLTSCITQKDLEYMQLKESTITSFSEARIPDYKLKPDDELYIQISSLDEAATDVFSNSGSQQIDYAGSMQPYGASLVSYTINKGGYLVFPIIGPILVKDYTISQVTQIIEDSLVNILSQPIVTVKLVNRYVSVLGEVRNPGHYVYAQEKLTIYDALGLAGDMTVYSNRRSVVLVRNENGKNSLIYLDLTRPQILESKYYYLNPNDMIYVKPLQKRFWGMSQFPFVIILSTISTALLIYSVVK